jgi:hypothetical protein
MGSYWNEYPSTAHRDKHPGSKVKITIGKKPEKPSNPRYGHAEGGFKTRKEAEERAKNRGYKI